MPQPTSSSDPVARNEPGAAANLPWRARDLAHVWHPCTQMKDHDSLLPLIPIRSGSGVWLTDFADQRYLDAISSWWVNLFGHANPRINAALRAQLDSLEHVILAGFTHEPVIRLSEALTALAPAGLTRCFYADNGSAAVEVAVKMSFHYWRNVGHSAKRRFVTLSGSYHGETLGALAVGNVELYKQVYQPLLMEVITVPSPDAFDREAGVSEAAWARRQFAHMERVLAEHAHEVAAVIVEPLVQCAAGMRMYDPVYLKLLREACDRHRVHLIADEIAVGFGRTGTLFACEQAGIRPDFMCLSKGLTGGYLPLSVVLTTADIYEAFYDEYVKLNAFLHSHSYTGNALACAAALATLEIFKQDPVLERNRSLARQFAQATAPLTDHPHVAEVRQRGMITAFEMVRDKRARDAYPWQERRGWTVYRHALSRGVLLRPIGNVVYFMPPYIIEPEHIDLMVQVAREGLELATCGLNRVHVEVPVGGRVYLDLDGTAANHVARVLRLRAGDALILFDNAGGEYAATVISLARHTVRVAVGEYLPTNRESPLHVTLAQGISRGERMDVVVQKATELGVWRIVPLLTERAVVRLNEAQAANRLRHWRAIAIAACEQCGRNHVPEITAPMALQKFLTSELPDGLRLLLNPDGGLRARNLPPGNAATLLIGPEGGLSDAERTAARAAQFQGLSLGPRILRTETAALAALAIIQQQLGDL